MWVTRARALCYSPSAGGRTAERPNARADDSGDADSAENNCIFKWNVPAPQGGGWGVWWGLLLAKGMQSLPFGVSHYASYICE